MFLKNRIQTNLILYICLLILFWVPRTLDLGFDQTNNDSARWFHRSEGFLQAIKDGNFENTYQKYHPGVTLMWVNSISRQFIYIYQYSFLSEKIDLFNPTVFPWFNFYSKVTLQFVIFTLILIQVLLISRIWNLRMSLIYFFLISVEPYFIGINRWFHLTSLEVVLSFTSLLMLLLFFKNNHKVHLILSSFFLSLAVLTKVTSLILLPLMLLSFIFFPRDLDKGERVAKNKKIEEIFLFFATLFFTTFILFPALWVNLIPTLLNISQSIFGAVEGDLRTTILSPYLEPIYYLIILLFKLSPITLFLVIVSFFHLKKFRDKYLSLILIAALFYFTLMTLSSQKIDRYSLVFFPSLLLLSSFYLSSLSFKKVSAYLIPGFLYLIYSFFVYQPNLSAHYSILFGGTQGAINTGVYENGGDYFFGAANYLNENKIQDEIWVPHNFEAFSYFYKGKSVRDINNTTKLKVTSLEMDRKLLNYQGCSRIIKEFGSLEKKVIGLCELEPR